MPTKAKFGGCTTSGWVMRVRWLRKALENLDHAADYIAQDNRSAAQALIEEVFRMTDLLADNPNLGRPGRVHATRELVMAHYPYIIPYRVRNGFVEILRVLHTSRQWPETLYVFSSYWAGEATQPSTPRKNNLRISRHSARDSALFRPRCSNSFWHLIRSEWSLYFCQPAGAHIHFVARLPWHV